MDPTSSKTVIIGGSAAGLAVAACLTKQNDDFVILEKDNHVGSAWRNHYDRLHLHTDRGSSQLPHLPMPKSYPRYPTRKQVIEYLEQYANHFGLAPQFGQDVVSIQRQRDEWETKTNSATYQSENVVIATGYTRVPNEPSWPGQQDFQGEILHSSAYKNGRSYQGKSVLVVGFGNSAGEIAIDLEESGAGEVVMSVRSPVNVIPRDLLGIPILKIGQVMDYLPPQLADFLAIPLIQLSIGNLTKYGLKKLPYGPNVQIRQDGQIPILDIGTVSRIKNGRIKILPGIERFEGNDVVFENGRKQEFDAIILGTGYRPEVHQILQGAAELLNAEGTPLSSGQEATKGLYFCGFYVSPTGMLREIGIEAKKIASAIAS